MTDNFKNILYAIFHPRAMLGKVQTWKAYAELLEPYLRKRVILLQPGEVFKDQSVENKLIILNRNVLIDNCVFKDCLIRYKPDSRNAIVSNTIMTGELGYSQLCKNLLTFSK